MGSKLSNLLTSRTILVVDDDTDIREALREMLSEEGYDVAEAKDGLAALEYLRASPAPALILLDWNMGRMSGAQFMVAVAHEPPLGDIPVVLLTADLRAAEKASSHGFVSYLKKPIDFEAFFAIVAHYCAAV